MSYRDVVLKNMIVVCECCKKFKFHDFATHVLQHVKKLKILVPIYQATETVEVLS